MSTTQTLVNATTDSTGTQHTHDTPHERCFVGFDGNSVFDGATVTPWVSIDGILAPAALVGVTFTAVDGGNFILLPTNAKVDLRITGAGASTDITASLVSPQAG